MIVIMHLAILAANVALVVLLVTHLPTGLVLPQQVVWWVLVAVVMASGGHSAWCLFKLLA